MRASFWQASAKPVLTPPVAGNNALLQTFALPLPGILYAAISCVENKKLVEKFFWLFKFNLKPFASKSFQPFLATSSSSVFFQEALDL